MGRHLCRLLAGAASLGAGIGLVWLVTMSPVLQLTLLWLIIALLVLIVCEWAGSIWFPWDRSDYDNTH